MNIKAIRGFLVLQYFESKATFFLTRQLDVVGQLFLDLGKVSIWYKYVSF